MHGIICSSRAHHFQGWMFENHAFLWPWPLKKNGDPMERMGRGVSSKSMPSSIN